MKILCVGYRDWSKNIYYGLKKSFIKSKFKFIFHFKKKSLLKKIRITKPELILFYGWSWIIKKKIYKNYECLMLHPSPLPKFRGGSPIQNQIIRNKKKSMVTIFRINNILDGGDIYYQKGFSLEGSLNQIFNRMVKIGIIGTKKILTKNIVPKKQNHKLATYYPRRKKKESEISHKELKHKSATYLYNKIRMLEDPYPNAYLRINKRKKLYFKKINIGN